MTDLLPTSRRGLAAWLEDRPGWMDAAVCRGLDPALFFPERGGTADAAAARVVCESCPVRAECLAHAVVHREDEGVWGGMTAGARKRHYHH